MWKLSLFPVVIGTLRSFTKDFERWIKKSRDSIQHWSDSIDCLFGNCKNSARNLEK